MKNINDVFKNILNDFAPGLKKIEKDHPTIENGVIDFKGRSLSEVYDWFCVGCRRDDSIEEDYSI